MHDSDTAGAATLTTKRNRMPPPCLSSPTREGLMAADYRPRRLSAARLVPKGMPISKAQAYGNHLSISERLVKF